MSWFCSRLISFSSVFLILQPRLSYICWSPGYGYVPEITRCFLGSQNPGGHTALHQAAGRGQCHGIEWMIGDGCNVGFSSIHFAEKTALSKM